jgi:mannose-6-phosphate isomerase-like protein (cupin superfamily)
LPATLNHYKMGHWCERQFFRRKDLFIKELNACEFFTAGDDTHLRELLHPDKADLKINYSLAHAVVNPGQASLRHRLRTSEVYYILEGRGLMHVNDETASVAPGQAIYIPPHAVQYIHNTGSADLVFLCIVDPAWRQEDEEIIL